MARLLGIPLTKKAVSEIDKIKLDIIHYYADSLTKQRVVEVLDKFVNQIPS
jgi:hypothetical protein